MQSNDNMRSIALNPSPPPSPRRTGEREFAISDWNANARTELSYSQIRRLRTAQAQARAAVRWPLAPAVAELATRIPRSPAEVDGACPDAAAVEKKEHMACAPLLMIEIRANQAGSLNLHRDVAVSAPTDQVRKQRRLIWTARLSKTTIKIDRHVDHTAFAECSGDDGGRVRFGRTETAVGLNRRIRR